MSSLPKEWYSRGYLPHFDHPGLVQMITFRLIDSLPVEHLEALAQEFRTANDPRRLRKIQEYLDAGHGSCSLRDPRVARLVEGTLLHFDTQRYRLLAWVVMPNHVHVMIETFLGYRLGEVVHSWKSYSSKEANKVLNRAGEFWQPDYFDRFIRNSRHFENAKRYTHENPVKAGLVSRPEDWPFSSATRIT